MDWKRKLVILAVPAALAVGGGSLIAAQAATTPTPTPSPSAAQKAPEAPETAASEAAEPAEAPEAPGAPEVGNADPAGAADNQFEGTQ
jgi:hypothetical protein